MNKKNTIRLTESDLKKVISESVKRVLKENDIENRISSLKNFFRALPWCSGLRIQWKEKKKEIYSV